MSNERLLRLPAVSERVGLKRAAIYSKIAAGSFPPGVKIGVRARAWPQSHIDKWIDDTIEASRPDRPRDTGR